MFKETFLTEIQSRRNIWNIYMWKKEKDMDMDMSYK